MSDERRTGEGRQTAETIQKDLNEVKNLKFLPGALVGAYDAMVERERASEKGGHAALVDQAVARVRLMAREDSNWDLSPNDKRELAIVLDALDGRRSEAASAKGKGSDFGTPPRSAEASPATPDVTLRLAEAWMKDHDADNYTEHDLLEMLDQAYEAGRVRERAPMHHSIDDNRNPDYQRGYLKGYEVGAACSIPRRESAPEEGFIKTSVGGHLPLDGLPEPSSPPADRATESSATSSPNASPAAPDHEAIAKAWCSRLRLGQSDADDESLASLLDAAFYEGLNYAESPQRKRVVAMADGAAGLSSGLDDAMSALDVIKDAVRRETTEECARKVDQFAEDWRANRQWHEAGVNIARRLRETANQFTRPDPVKP